MDKDKLVTEVGYLFKIKELTDELGQASNKIVELVDDVVRLKEALLPFAKEATHWVNYPDDEPLVEAFPGYEGELTIGDLRRAYDVLLKDTVYE